MFVLRGLGKGRDDAEGCTIEVGMRRSERVVRCW